MTKGKSIFKLIVGETTGFALNFIPLALWFFEDYSNETVMLLYLAECVVAVVLGVLCFVVLVPAEERVGNFTIRRNEILSKFLLVIGIFFVVVSMFTLTFIFLESGPKPVPLEGLKTGLMIILAFQLFEFFTNLYLLRPLPLRRGEFFLGQSLGGFALLAVSIMIGMIVAFITGKNYWFVLVFVIFKTIIDILAPIQFLRGKTPAEVEPLHRHVTYKSNYKFPGKRLKG